MIVEVAKLFQSALEEFVFVQTATDSAFTEAELARGCGAAVALRCRLICLNVLGKVLLHPPKVAVHLIDCLEPTVGHVQPWSHLSNDLERLSCGFEPFALSRGTTWLHRRLCTHVAVGIHPREVDAIDSHEGDRINGESNYGRLDEHVPLLTCSSKVHKVSGSLETLTSAILPIARRNVVLGWWEQGRIQGTLRLLTAQGDEGHIFSVQHDLAEKIDCVDQGVWRRFVYGDVRLDVLWREQIVSGETGFEILARAQELEVIGAWIPWRVFLGSGNWSVKFPLKASCKNKPSSACARPLDHFAVNLQYFHIAAQQTLVGTCLKPTLFVIFVMSVHPVWRRSFCGLSGMTCGQHRLTVRLDLVTVDTVPIEIIKHQRSHLLSEGKRPIACWKLCA